MRERSQLLGVIAVAGCLAHGETTDVVPAGDTSAPAPAAAVIPEVRPLVDPWPPEPELEAAEPSPTPEELAQQCAAGRAGARAAAESGVMTLDAWGYPADCARVYWRLLYERYDVSVVHHGCVVEPEPATVLEYRRCYHDEVEAIVRERHGEDAFEVLSAEAKRVCESQAATSRAR